MKVASHTAPSDVHGLCFKRFSLIQPQPVSDVGIAKKIYRASVYGGLCHYPFNFDL